MCTVYRDGVQIVETIQVGQLMVERVAAGLSGLAVSKPAKAGR